MKYYKLFLAISFLFFLMTLPIYADKKLPNSPDFSEKKDIHIIYNTGKNDKICGITLLFKWGVADEESYVQGMRSFIAELIYKQIEDIKTDDGITALESYGIGVNTEIESDYILLKSSCMKEDFPFVLEKLCEAVSNPFKDEKLFEEAKKDYVKKYKDKNGVIDNVYSLFLTEFYKYHPYRHINSYSVGNIEKLSFKQAQDFLSKLLKRDRIYISASGRFNQEKADKIINKYFSKFGLSEIKPEEIQWDTEAGEKQKFLTASSPNGYLLIGYSAPSYSSSDYFTMLVANNLTGNGFGSRFWREIREKNGMAYGLGGIYPA
ncbi:insulinase family protein, partial [bacterium]|nr:insulinase family protein [bacterium]